LKIPASCGGLLGHEGDLETELAQLVDGALAGTGTPMLIQAG
jgi:hypothetical protein